jgi:hypothetical protein
MSDRDDLTDLLHGDRQLAAPHKRTTNSLPPTASAQSASETASGAPAACTRPACACCVRGFLPIRAVPCYNGGR